MNLINPILYKQNETLITKQKKSKLKTASVSGSLLGIMGGVATVYLMARSKNPNISLKNYRYTEKDVLVIGAGSVLGGLLAGSVVDKNNADNKLREASQQYIGNMVFPVCFLAMTEHLLEKINTPQFKANNNIAKMANMLLKGLPKSIAIILALVSGMEIGNKVMNKVNNKIFKKEVKHEIKKEDYLVHLDDICLASNFLLKDAKSIASVTSKILPFTFVVAGTKTGLKQSC